MQPTVYQKPELRDANDNIIQQGAFGKNTALANATNDGWIDYVANDLEFLYDIAKDEIVPVPSLPASGQTNKTYLLTTTGVSYRWSGTEWVAVSSSEAVGRAESAANLAEQWATKTDGTVDGTEYSAKYYAGLAEASADDAQDVADDMADHLVQIDKNTGGVAKNSKRISNIEKLLQGNLYDYDTDDDVAYTKTVPSGALPYAGIEQIGGKTLVMNQKANSINATYWQRFGANVSVTYADGVAECTLQNDTASAYMYGLELLNAYAYNIVDGHKYYYSYEVKINITGTRFFNQCVTSSSINDGAIDTANIWIQKNNIVTATAVNPRRCLIYPSTNLTGLVYSVRNAMVIDLTLMYGAGNEPSTVAEFEAMFPASYYPYNAGTLLSAGVTSVVSKDSNDDALQTLSIPAEVQALEGYGWSVGNVRNYIDFERKVFVRNVAQTTFDGSNDEGWWIIPTGGGTDAPRYAYRSINYMEQTSAFLQIINDRNIPVHNTSGGASADDSIVTMRSTNYIGSILYIFAPTTQWADLAAFKAWLSANPLTIQYPLATPVETDISQYLTDNLIEVGAGGTLTFPNANGDDYHIPVPSTETYMIDLQEAISNG